jgi:vitamin B12 transporter
MQFRARRGRREIVRLHQALTFLLLAGSSTLAMTAFAQTSTATPSADDTVIIEALRLGQTEAEAGTSVSVVDQKDIERRALVFGGDAVASVAGVTVSQAGSFGGASYARIRGNASGQTLVLVDGVPMNDPSSPSGGFDFSTFDLSDVARIEVLRGPQSTLWGSDAIGGVISIVTKRPEKGFGWGGFAEAGSFDTYRVGSTVTGGSDRADGRLSAVWQSSDGISKADERDGNTEKDGFDSFSLSGRGGVNIVEGMRLNVTARWTKADYDFDGFPPPSFSALGDTSENTKSNELEGSATLAAKAFGGRLENTLQFTRMEIDRKNFDTGVETSRNKGDQTGYRYNGMLQVADGQRLGFGVEREESSANGSDAKTNSLFALYEWAPTDRLMLTGGIRYDDDDRYGSATTGKVAASWRAMDNLRLRATWGQGFMAPTIFQSTFICSFCGLTAPNPNLKAATSDAYDVGVDWTIADVDLSLTLFDQRTKNLIDFTNAAGYDNIALAKQRGVEASVHAPITKWFAVDAGYAYIDGEDGFGRDLPRVPMNSGNLEFIFTPFAKFTGSVAVRYNDDQSDGFGPRVKGWTRTDLSAGYEFMPGLEIYSRIENLFDVHYQQIGGYGAPGVSGLVGIRLTR